MPSRIPRWYGGWKAFTRWSHFLMEKQLLATVFVVSRRREKLKHIFSAQECLERKIEDELEKVIGVCPERHLPSSSDVGVSHFWTKMDKKKENTSLIQTIGRPVDWTTVRLLDDAAAYACAAYELSAGMVSPVFATHVNPTTQPILHRLLLEDAPSHHLVDFQFSKAPNTASFFILSRTARREIVLSFRGTQEFGDFLTDMMCSKGEGVDAVFHTGALESILRDYERIEMTIVHLAEAFPDFSIIIAGHSLGGGLAVTFAVHFLTAMKVQLPSLLSRTKVVTFGAMASLTAKGLAQYEEFSDHIYNVVSPRDPVPHVVTPVLTLLAESAPVPSPPPPPPILLQNPSQFLSAAVSGFVKGEQKQQDDLGGEEKDDTNTHDAPEIPKDEVQDGTGTVELRDGEGKEVQEVNEERVLALAFFESSPEELNTERHRQIVSNAVHMYPSSVSIRNPKVPILYQLGRFFVLVRRFALCYAAEVDSFHEVILAHLALSGFADLIDESNVNPNPMRKGKKGKNRIRNRRKRESADKDSTNGDVRHGIGEEDHLVHLSEEPSSSVDSSSGDAENDTGESAHSKDDGSFRSFVDGFSESWKKYQKTAEHNMVVIPDRLKRNLDFHSILKYQESLAMLDCHESTLQEAELVFLRRRSGIISSD